MSVMDDAGRFMFERAKGKYNRAQFDQMSTDEWVALVEGLNDVIKSRASKSPTQL